MPQSLGEGVDVVLDPGSQNLVVGLRRREREGEKVALASTWKMRAARWSVPSVLSRRLLPITQVSAYPAPDTEQNKVRSPGKAIIPNYNCRL